MVEGSSSDKRKFSPFEDARKLVRELGLKNKREWDAWVKQYKSADYDIPAHPEEAYRDKGWMGWGDWLGAAVPKQKLTLTIDNDIIDRAKGAGLNLSEVTEQTLDILTYDLRKKEDSLRENLVNAYDSFFCTVKSILNKYGITIEVGKIHDDQNNTDTDSLLLLSGNGGLLITEGIDRASAKPVEISKVIRFLFNPNIILKNLLLEMMQREQNDKNKIAELKFATRFLTTLSNGG